MKIDRKTKTVDGIPFSKLGIKPNATDAQIKAVMKDIDNAGLSMTKNKILTVIKCQHKGCGKLRKVYTSDVFQVKYCREHQKTNRAAQTAKSRKANPVAKPKSKKATKKAALSGKKSVTKKAGKPKKTAKKKK